MGKNKIEEFIAYQKACKLFDFVIEDMDKLKKNRNCNRLISQQIGSADSICANIYEATPRREGYGRLHTTEYIRFLDIARGSTRETRGRYKRMKHWLSEDIVKKRVHLLDEIIGILTSTISTLKRKK